MLTTGDSRVNKQGGGGDLLPGESFIFKCVRSDSRPLSTEYALQSTTIVEIFVVDKFCYSILHYVTIEFYYSARGV